jgi:transposase
MPEINDLSRSLTAFEQDRTLVVVVEISLSSWLVAGVLPGVARQPMKKLGPDETPCWLSSAAGRTKPLEQIAT